MLSPSMYSVSARYSKGESAPRYHTLYARRSDAYVDILDPEVTDAFLRSTYEPYYARFSERFGKISPREEKGAGDAPHGIFIAAQQFFGSGLIALLCGEGEALVRPHRRCRTAS